MPKILKIALKSVMWTLVSIVALFALTVVVLNIAKFGIYSEYYSLSEGICRNPGLNDGFICQGIAVSEEDGRIFVCGYMNSDERSRVYVTDYSSNSYYVSLDSDGKPFTGHCGGMARYEDRLYVVSGSTLYTFPIGDVLEAKNGDIVDIGTGVKMPYSTSFVFCDDTYLYVGEFHNGGKYVTNNIYETAEGTHHAIIARYPVDDIEHPDKIYSIRNKVQGVAMTPEGDIVLSTSYGLTSSVYYIYKEADATLSDNTLFGAPVYYLENVEREFTGPAMSEDLDYSGGKIYTITECASNKYIFGKFFFAFDIDGIEINKNK